MADPFEHHVRLKKPCGNCPFRKQGAIELRRGRLEQIIADLLASDSNSFSCHKTLGPQHAEIDDDDPGPASRVAPSADESLCAGAAAYLMKKGRPSICMRIAFHLGLAKPTDWDDAQKLIID